MIDLTAEIKTDQVKKAYEEMRKNAQRSIRGQISDFDLLDAAVLRFSTNLGRVGKNFDLGTLEVKIRHAQRIFGELGKISTPEGSSEKATAEARKLTDAINSLNAELERTQQIGGSGFMAIVDAAREARQEIDSVLSSLGKAHPDIATSTSGAGASPSNNTAQTKAETDAVREQRIAYDDLLEVLEVSAVKRAQIAEQIKETEATYQQHLKTVKEINRIEAKLGEGERLTSEQTQAREEAKNAIEAERSALRMYKNELREQDRILNAASGSIDQMTASLNRLRTEYSSLSEDDRLGERGKQIEAYMDALQQRIAGVDGAMRTQIGTMGGYNKGFNALQFQIQQVARELPALAYGPQIFFSALSNNLPMLADEIARTKKELGGMRPVLKQIFGSVVSWQTLLIAGVTIFTMYGKEIGEWVGSLFKGRKALDEMAAAQKVFNDTMTRGAIDAQSEAVKFQLLYKTATDNAAAMGQRTKAIDEIRKLYPSYLEGLSNEEIMLGKASDAYEKITTSIYQAAKARAAFSKLVELGEVEIAAQAPDYRARAEEAKRRQEMAKAYRQNVMGVSFEQVKAYNTMIRQQERAEQDAFNDWIKTQGDKFEWIKAQGIKTFDELDAYISRTSKALEPTAALGLTGQTPDDKAEAFRKAQEEAEARRRAEQEAIKQLEQMRIEAQEKEIELQADGLQKELTQIAFEYERKKAAINEGEKALREKRQEAGGGGLTRQDRKILTQYRKAVDDDYNKQVAAAYQKVADDARKSQEEAAKAELSAMLDYLKAYGTIQQQKYAIAEEYNRKIAASTNEWEKKTLTKEREAAIAKVSAQAIRDQIDWATVFSELGGMFAGVVQPTIDALRSYIATDEFKQLQPGEQQAIVEGYNNLSGGGDQTATFKGLGEAINTYHTRLQRLTDLTNEEVFSYAELKRAQEAYKEAMESGTDAEKKAAAEWVKTAEETANSVSQVVQDQQQTVEDAQSKMSAIANELYKSIDTIHGGLQKMQSDSLASIYGGFNDVAKGLSKQGGKVGEAFDRVAEALDGVPIVREILGIVDVFKDGFTEFFTSIIDTVLGAVETIIKDVITGDFGVGIVKSVVDGVGNILDAVTFGAFSNLNGSNGKEVQAITEKLTLSNEYLKESIDALKSTIEKSSGVESVNAYNKAVEYQKQVIQNTGDILGAQMGYHGSHHSNNYYINKALKKADWARISELVGQNVTYAGQLWDLTPEQLRKIQANDYALWQKIATAGKYDKSEYLNDYVELAGTLEELADGLKESLTGITFDGLKDDFMNTLMQMDVSSKDFADSFAEYMMKAMLSAKISNAFNKRIEEWYNRFAEYAKSDNELTEAEIDELREEYEKLAREMIDARNQIAEVTGYGSTAEAQSATARGFQTMSQETGSELNGRFTDIQGKITDMRAQGEERLMMSRRQLEEIAYIRSVIDRGVNYAQDTRDVLLNISGDVSEIRMLAETLPRIHEAISKTNRILDNKL